jgi:hypothetical protein
MRRTACARFIPIVVVAVFAADARGQSVLIGKGGLDGFVASGRDGTIHVVIGGRYRQGPAPDRLSAEETITDVGPMNTVRMSVDGEGRPHVVFSTGQTARAKRSYYTARIGGRWLPAEKFADAEEIPERTRAYVADVASDERGNVLVSFWVGRPTERRAERDNPSFYYRWRTPDGRWSERQSLPAHWSSAAKVEHAPGRGFYLLWQSINIDWRIAGPVAAGGMFTEARSFSSGSNKLMGLSTVQNEGADFSVAPDGTVVATGNVREKFEGPVGVWAAFPSAAADSSAKYLGSFADTKRGDESGVHPVMALDAATGVAFLTVMNPADKKAYFAEHQASQGWQGYRALLTDRSGPQGTLRQGPSVADVPGPGAVALVRDGEENWHLKMLQPGKQ